MKLRNIIRLSLQSVREYLTSRFTYLILFFIIILLYAGVLAGIMAVNEEKKVLLDFFISITQISVFMFSIFISSLAITQDLETKRIYMVLSRPISHIEYILAKILGVYISCLFIIFSISIISSIILLFKGYFFNSSYFFSILNIYIKIIYISTVSLFFSIITTSPFTAIGISVLIWFITHFINELNFAVEKTKGILYFMKFVLYLFPDFSSYGNYQNLLSVCGYTFVLIAGSWYFFKKMEI